jgi:riboflavin-specific deaminase-like protein
MDDRQQQDWLDRLSLQSAEFLDCHHRPMVTVSYAQSIDGSIATRNRQQLQLSGQQSMLLTHRIRDACDAILVGINTVMIDDPQLTARLPGGTSPQAIVLDSTLRMPMKARLLERSDFPCWLACTDRSDVERIMILENQGLEIIQCHSDSLGRVDLLHLLRQLGERGIRSIMVEGGSQVITSFIEARLVEQMIITVAPCFVGGLPIINGSMAGNGALMHLEPVSYQACGSDIVLWGTPQWQTSGQ